MDLKLLQQTMLFSGMSEEEISETLHTLHAVERTYKKGEILLHAGSVTDQIGLVMDGSVTIESNDMWGNRTILNHVGKNHFFAETYAVLRDTPMLVDVVANENCSILFLRMGTLHALCGNSKPWMFKFITNLLCISSEKNLILSGRSFHTAPKTIRGKVMSYLNSVSLQKNSMQFDIPFDRQQMADYLNVDRTALSKELGKMRADGIIAFHKNHFIIKESSY